MYHSTRYLLTMTSTRENKHPLNYFWHSCRESSIVADEALGKIRVNLDRIHKLWFTIEVKELTFQKRAAYLKFRSGKELKHEKYTNCKWEDAGMSTIHENIGKILNVHGSRSLQHFFLISFFIYNLSLLH